MSSQTQPGGTYGVNLTEPVSDDANGLGVNGLAPVPKNPVGRPPKKFQLASVVVVVDALRTEAASLRLLTTKVISGQEKTVGRLRTGLWIKAEQIDRLADELSEM